MPLQEDNAQVGERSNWHTEEHAEINKRLTTIEGEFDLPPYHPDKVPVIILQLRSFRSLLRVHFENEEKNGLQCEFPAIYPRLVSGLNRLEAQHSELLEHLDLTIQLVADSLGPFELDTARRAFKIFVVELRHHEDGEVRSHSERFLRRHRGL